MNKILKSFEAIASLIKNPWLLNHILSNDEVWQEKVERKYGKGFSLPMVEINTLCPGFSEKLDCFSFLGGGSLPTDIALLKQLCRKFENCNFFEIGTWRGETIINVMDVCNECYTLNLSNADLQNMGVPQKYIELNGYFSKHSTKIKQLIGNSMNFDFGSLDKKFDVIFIDGNHHYDFVKNDTEKVFKHLVHEKSIVVWHDYMHNPEKPRPEVMSAIMDGTPENFREHLYYVSNTMCAIFTKEKLETKKFETPTKPNKIFEVNIECKPFS